jgi:GPH family glycoside/pentoside/hexuronide:cation symporter
MFGYSLGDGGISIVMNGIGNFAMLFYTQILGLSAVYAGIALSVTTFWDAISDPLMGHISDHTRSRFGRRLPYLLPGGLLMALTFLALWVLPQQFESARGMFWCVLLLNLLLRTFLTVFMVPHTALGFELCPEYVDRSRLQGMRNFVNQMTNLVFGAFAWMLFFKDGTAVDGSRIDGTAIAGNYLTMAGWLAGMICVILAVYLLSVRSCREDTRTLSTEGRSVVGFFKNMAAIFKDRLAWFVFGLVGFGLLAMLLVSQVQMFTYVYYMQFNEVEKTCVHGAGMVSAALCGLLLLPVLVKRFDKKGAAYASMGLSCFGGVMLAAVFNGGLLAPGQIAGSLPVATIVFGLLQALWWGGAGMLVALAM